MRWIFMALLLVSLCGCSTVVSTRPMGEASLDLSGQTDKWTGTWRAPVGLCILTVVLTDQQASANGPCAPQVQLICTDNVSWSVIPARTNCAARFPEHGFSSGPS